MPCDFFHAHEHRRRRMKRRNLCIFLFFLFHYETHGLTAYGTPSSVSLQPLCTIYAAVTPRRYTNLFACWFFFGRILANFQTHVCFLTVHLFLVTLVQRWCLLVGMPDRFTKHMTLVLFITFVVATVCCWRLFPFLILADDVIFNATHSRPTYAWSEFFFLFHWDNMWASLANFVNQVCYLLWCNRQKHVRIDRIATNICQTLYLVLTETNTVIVLFFLWK